MKPTNAAGVSVGGFGATLQRSPGPLTVVGHLYEHWPFGRSTVQYRVEVTMAEYNRVVRRLHRRIRRHGGTPKQMDAMLFEYFKPK